MATLILVARPCEITSLIQWVCNEYYADTPTDCPVIADTIRQRISTLLQAYFVRDRREKHDVLDDALTALLGAIGNELTQTVAALTQKGYHIRSVDTFAIDGSTRFILTMLTGEDHEQPLPVTDTG